MLQHIFFLHTLFSKQINRKGLLMVVTQGCMLMVDLIAYGVAFSACISMIATVGMLGLESKCFLMEVTHIHISLDKSKSHGKS